MNLLGILTALVGAITAAFLALSGAPTAPQQQAIAQIASTTDAVVQEATKGTTAPTTEDVAQAYELGKAVGKLQQQAQPITSPATTTMQDNSTTGSPSTTQPSTTAAPAATPQPTTAPAASGPTSTAPASQARIEIVSPIAGKGLGRQYASSTQIVDESNYIELGAVLYDADGQPVSTEKMTITATDDEQDAIEVGTGDVMPKWVNGDKREVPVYSFHYAFKTGGQHTITFTSAGGITASVTLDVK